MLLRRVVYLATQKEIPDTYLLNKKRIATVKKIIIYLTETRTAQHSTIIEPFS